jgi:hypothetical protein
MGPASHPCQSDHFIWQTVLNRRINHELIHFSWSTCKLIHFSMYTCQIYLYFVCVMSCRGQRHCWQHAICTADSTTGFRLSCADALTLTAATYLLPASWSYLGSCRTPAWCCCRGMTRARCQSRMLPPLDQITRRLPYIDTNGESRQIYGIRQCHSARLHAAQTTDFKLSVWCMQPRGCHCMVECVVDPEAPIRRLLDRSNQKGGQSCIGWRARPLRLLLLQLSLNALTNDWSYRGGEAHPAARTMRFRNSDPTPKPWTLRCVLPLIPLEIL